MKEKSYGDAKSAIVNFLNKNIAYDEKSEGIKDSKVFLVLEKKKPVIIKILQQLQF